MEFGLTAAQRRLRERCLALAADFATSSAAHDRDGTHPLQNYERLKAEGFLALTVAEEYGGAGHSFLDHTIAYEALGQGCPSTALAFNMHASVVMPILQSPEIGSNVKAWIADLVVGERAMIGGNFSEPSTTSLIGERPLATRVRRVAGGWRITGRKMFASMLGASDFTMVLAYPDDATAATAGALVMVPREAPGRSVNLNWDVLGMRATRSDQLILQDCLVPAENVILRTDDIRGFRHAYLNWFWGSYTAVYLGLAVAALDELIRAAHARWPEGYAQALAWHPDVRRHVGELSAELEAARLITYRSAWLSDTEGPTAETTAALYRAKYAVGRAVSSITRVGLTLGGAHGIFKGSRMEQLFRDGALAEIQPPPTDFCLHQMGIHALGLDAAEMLPPMKPA